MWLFVALASAQTVPNASLDADIPAAVPNTFQALEWTYDGTDVAQVGLLIDCADLLTLDSADGDQFARALDFFDAPSGVYRQQGLSATVTDLVVGAPHMVRFEASIVRHYGQSTGFWSVTLDAVQLDAPILPLPAANPAQGPWEAQEVGPFTPVATSATLDFTAHTLEDGLTESPILPGAGCNYESLTLATDLLIDGIVVVADRDFDGLYDDEEAAIGTDPESADTDTDGLLDPDELSLGTDPLASDTDLDGAGDREEVDFGTDPLVPDTDGDGALDGQEILLDTDPFDPDSDDDGLLDGDELTRGTDPLLSDSDGDGLNDGAEVGSGTDPTDPQDPFFPETVTVETTPPTGTVETTYPPLDEREVPKPNDMEVLVGCECSSASGGHPAWAWALLWGAAFARRRAR